MNENRLTNEYYLLFHILNDFRKKCFLEKLYSPADADSEGIPENDAFKSFIRLDLTDLRKIIDLAESMIEVYFHKKVTIEVKIYTRKNTNILGSARLNVGENKHEIIVATEHNRCYQRLTIVKELCQILLFEAYTFLRNNYSIEEIENIFGSSIFFYEKCGSFEVMRDIFKSDIFKSYEELFFRNHTDEKIFERISVAKDASDPHAFSIERFFENPELTAVFFAIELLVVPQNWINIKNIKSDPGHQGIQDYDFANIILIPEIYIKNYLKYKMDESSFDAYQKIGENYFGI